jgi:starvation-inducible outer membrane lipoprotein
MQQLLWPGLAAALTLGLAACGDSGSASDLSYAQVQRAAAGGDQARFRDWFQDVQGQRVAWNGRVVEVAKEHGDDFVEITTLIIDLDGDRGGTTDGDVRLPVSQALADNMYPGREVSFTGRIEDFDWTARRPVLRLEAQRIE